MELYSRDANLGDSAGSLMKTKWKKYVLFISLTIVVLALMLASMLSYYLHSASFERLLVVKIKAALAKVGLQAEIADLKLDWATSHVTLHNVKITNKKTGQAIVSVEDAVLLMEVQNLYSISFNQHFILQKLDLQGVNFLLALDKDNQINLPDLSNKENSRNNNQIDYSHLAINVTNSQLQFQDQHNDIDLMLPRTNFTVQLTANNSAQVQVQSGGGDFRYLSYSTNLNIVDCKIAWERSLLKIDSVKLETPVSALTVHGTINGAQNWHYLFDLQGHTQQLESIMHDINLKGDANFTGRLEGEGSKFAINGIASSQQLTWQGYQLNELKPLPVSLTYQEGRLDFSSDKVEARQAIYSQINALNVVGTEFKGHSANNNVTLTLANLAVQSLQVPQAQLSQIKVAPITMNIEIKEHNSVVKLETKQATAAHLTAKQNQLNTLVANKIQATFVGRQYQLSAQLSSQTGILAQTSLGVTQGILQATPQLISLHDVNGDWAGGKVALNLDIAPKGQSMLQANFSQISANSLAKGKNFDDRHFVGTVTGSAQLTWPGFQLEQTKGPIMFMAQGDALATNTILPVQAQAEIELQGRPSLNINHLTASIGNNRLTAQGLVNYDGNIDLKTTFQADQAAELVTLARTFHLTQLLDDYQIELADKVSFTGKITDTIKTPKLMGQLTLSRISCYGNTANFRGDIALSATEVSIQKGLLQEPSGGQVDFNFRLPLTKIAQGGELEAQCQNLRVVFEDKTKQLFVGRITGPIKVENLLGTPKGVANLAILDSKLLDQPLTTPQANISLQGNLVELSVIKAESVFGQITGIGTIDLKTQLVDLTADLANLRIGQLLQTPTLTGNAQAQLSIRGNLKELDKLAVKLDSHIQNLNWQGQQIGDVTLKSTSTNQGSLETEIIVEDFLGKRQVINVRVVPQTKYWQVLTQADLKGLNLAAAVALAGKKLPDNTGGNISANLQLQAQINKADFAIQNLQGNISLTKGNLQLNGTPVQLETPTEILIDATHLQTSRLHLIGSGTDLVVTGSVPINSAGQFDVTIAGQTNLHQISLPPEITLQGDMTLNAQIKGTLAQPILTGMMNLTEVGFQTEGLPVAITRGKGRLDFDDNAIIVRDFSALANGRPLDGGGRISLKGLIPESFRLRLSAQNLDIIYQDIDVNVDSRLVLRGTPDKPIIRGNITINQADYLGSLDLKSLARNFAGTTSSSSQSFKGFVPSLEIEVKADSTIILNNDQIDTLASANININGNLARPNIAGNLSLGGGTIKFRDQRYNITNGDINILGNGYTPIANLLAEADIHSYHVYVRLTGPLDRLDVALEAEPSLSRDEIISLITTGRADSTAGNPNLLTNAGVGGASFLTEEFISKPFRQKTQDLLGLTRFQLDPLLLPNENLAARLTVGRQLTRNLSFTYSTSLASENSQRFVGEYTLSNRFSASATYIQGGNSVREFSNDNELILELGGRRRFSLGKRLAPVVASVINREVKPRPTLPSADVTVNLPPGIKIKEDRLTQLLPIKKRGFSVPLIKLGERNLTNYFQEQGFFMANVLATCPTADCVDTNKVDYQITLGPRYKVSDIKLFGTKLRFSEVAGELQSQKPSLIAHLPLLNKFIGGFALGVSSNDRLRSDQELLRQRLTEMGYLQAKVSADSIPTVDGKGVTIVFNVEEGAQTLIQEIVIKDLAGDLLPQYYPIIKLKQGDVLVPSLIQDSAQQLKNYFGKQGFLEAQVTVDWEEIAPNQLRIIYQIDAGSQAIAQDIVIKGAVITKESALRRFIDLKPGDILRQDKIQRIQQELYATGSFRDISINVVPLSFDDNNDVSVESLINIATSQTSLDKRRVLIRLTEVKPLLLVYGLGYSSDDGPRGSLQLTNNSFLGQIKTLAFKMRASGREQNFQTQYTDLRSLGSRFATTVSLTYNRTNNVDGILRQRGFIGTNQQTFDFSFGIERLTAAIQTERKLDEKNSFRFGYRYELVRINNAKNVPNSILGDLRGRLAILSAGFSRDNRDNPINPTQGYLFSADYNFATKLLGSNAAFEKLFTNYQYYQQLKVVPGLRQTILAFSARIGLAHSFDRQPSSSSSVVGLLPFSERFRSGGSTTLRGFQFEAAGPQQVLEVPGAPPQLVSIGGNAVTVFNFELRYPLTNRLQVVPFYDLGNVFRQVKSISFGQMTNTVGLGLRFTTPIGPIGIDYGYLLDPPSFSTSTGGLLTPKRGVIHIKIGQSF